MTYLTNTQTFFLLSILMGMSSLNGVGQGTFRVFENRHDISEDSLDKAISFQEWNERVQLTRDLKYYKPFLKDTREHVLQKLRDRHFIKNDSMEHKIQNIFQRILVANELDFSYVTFIDDNPAVQAGVNLTGVFVFSFGLMMVAQTDDELAMMVAHTIAHHMNFDAADIVGDYYHLDVDVVPYTAFRSIAENRGSILALKAMQSVDDKMRDSHKVREFYADSVALTYLKNAGYNGEHGAAILHKLGYRYLDDYPGGFDVVHSLFSNEYPPLEEWFRPRLFTATTEPGLDSVVVYPYLDQRIMRLSERFPAVAINEQERVIKTLNEDELAEWVKGAYTSKEFEVCLYLGLLGSSKYPDNCLFSSIVGKLFLDLYNTTLDHDVATNVFIYLDYHSVNLNAVLTEVNAFLLNLTIQEYLRVGYNYLLNSQVFDSQDKVHHWLLFQYAGLLGDNSLASQVSTSFQTKFGFAVEEFQP